MCVCCADLHVEMEGGVLRISGERKEEKTEENERWHVQERRWGSTTRAIRLPRNANPEDIQVWGLDMGVDLSYAASHPCEKVFESHRPLEMCPPLLLSEIAYAKAERSAR